MSMITEKQLINLGFMKTYKQFYHGDPGIYLFEKNGLKIKAETYNSGDTIDYVESLEFKDCSNQISFNTLTELDKYFIGCGKKSIFI